MDDFSWGNTRLVIGEGNNKKVLMNEDEKFDDSMIPLKKFSGKLFIFSFLDMRLNGFPNFRIRGRSMGYPLSPFR